MKTTKTDRSSVVLAEEFLWDTDAETEVHGYVWPNIAQYLGKGEPQRLLDLGCGNGALTRKLATLVPHCVGMDFSKSGIEIAAQKFPEVTFHCSPLSSPLPPELCGTFDVVTAVEVVEHLLLPRQLFDRAREALKPNGRLLVTTPYHGYLKNLALAIAGKFDSHWHPLRDYGHVKFFSKSTIESLFAEQGFQVDYFARVGRLPPFARSMLVGGTLKSRTR
jgi:2-polyprenyl-6-hydroxyphenyl methylase/3-demethylubiquinone-9 3-methyltransferase